MCCCQPCEIIRDEFDDRGSTGSTYGSTWSIEAGTWNVVNPGGSGDGWGLETGSTNALALVTKKAIGKRHSIRARFRSIASGAQARIYFNYLDSNNHSFAEITGGQPVCTVKQVLAGTAIEVVQIYDELFLSGVRAEIQQYDGADDFTVISADDSSVFGDFGRSSPYKFVSGGITGGRSFGLGTGGTVPGAVVFDSVLGLNWHTRGESCYDADQACSDCVDGLLPRELQVVIAGADAVAYGIDGTYSLPYGRGLVSFAAPTSCVYRNPSIGSGFGVYQVYFTAGRIEVTAIDDNSTTVQWRYDLPADTDCKAISGLDVPLYDPGGYDATCTVSVV